MSTLLDRTGPGYRQYRAGSAGTLVLLHGFLDKAVTWRLFADTLNLPDWNVIAIELGDFGLPDKSATNVLDYLTQQTTEVIAGLDIDPDKPLVLVGHSMGGQIAELVAARLQSVAGLALLVPAPLKGYPLNEEQQKAFSATAAQKEKDKIAAGRGSRLITATAEGLDLLVTAPSQTPVDFSLMSLQAWTEGHPSGHAQTVTVAPMLLVTTDDKFFTPDFLFDAVLSRFESGTTDHVAAAGHWPHVEQPAALAAIIEEFVLNKCAVVAHLTRWFFHDYVKKWAEISAGTAPATDMLNFWGAPLHAAAMVQTAWLMKPEDVMQQIARTQALLEGKYSHTVVLDHRISVFNKSAATIDAIWSRRQKDETELQRVASHFEIHMTDGGWRVVAMANRMTKLTRLDHLWAPACPVLPRVF